MVPGSGGMKIFTLGAKKPGKVKCTFTHGFGGTENPYKMNYEISIK